MKILPLGVGSAFAKTLNHSNYLISPARGEPLLLDCGHTAPRALKSLGHNPKDVTQILLSHLHADHIGGLEELGFCGYFVWGRRPALFLPESLYPDLWTHALQAGMGQRLKGGDGRFFNAELSTYFDLRMVKPRASFHVGSLVVTPVRVPHVPGRSCWGYRMEDEETGGKVLFTCDSRLSLKNLETHGGDVDLIFHDCQLNGETSAIHACREELLQLAPHWQEKILLVHVDDDWEQYEGKVGMMRFAREGQTYSL